MDTGRHINHRSDEEEDGQLRGTSQVTAEKSDGDVLPLSDLWLDTSRTQNSAKFHLDLPKEHNVTW